MTVNDTVPIPEPEREPVQNWWFTFGSGQEFDGFYTVINGTYLGARDLMVAHFGTAWCDQYGSAEAARIEEFGLRRLDASQWPPAQLDTSLIHYDTDTLDLLTGCGRSLLSELGRDSYSTDPEVVDCPACAATLVDGQLADAEAPDDDLRRCANCDEPVAFLSSREWCDGCEEEAADEQAAPAAPERITVSVEVLTPELRAVADAAIVKEFSRYNREPELLPPESRAAVVVRHDGTVDHVTDVETDVPQRNGAEALAWLLHQAQGRAGNLDAELLMPTPDVLAALAGRPVGAYTAPLELRADQVDAGWVVRSFASEGDELLVRAVVECDDATCPWGADCCVVVADATEPVHFAPWQDLTVRIPAGER